MRPGARYKLVRRMAEGVYVLRDPYGREQVWSQRAVRKPHRCDATKTPIAVGDRAYAPLTNSVNRMARLARNFVENLRGERDQ